MYSMRMVIWSHTRLRSLRVASQRQLSLEDIRTLMVGRYQYLEFPKCVYNVYETQAEMYAYIRRH